MPALGRHHDEWGLFSHRETNIATGPGGVNGGKAGPGPSGPSPLSRTASFPLSFEQPGGSSRLGVARIAEEILGNDRRIPKSPSRTIPNIMKLPSLLTFVLSLALGLTSTLAADDTPLMKEMKAMNKSLRTLKRQVADATKKDDNVQLIAGIKKNIDASVALQPTQTKDIPAAEKAAYLDKYKAQMGDLTKMFDELDGLVKEGKTDAAAAVFEKLSQAKEKGHKDFGADE